MCVCGEGGGVLVIRKNFASENVWSYVGKGF